MKIGDVKVFQSTSSFDGAPGFRERSGQTVDILRELSADEVDLSETGPMWHVRFEDGTEMEAFENELTS